MPGMFTIRREIECTACDWSCVDTSTTPDYVTLLELLPTYPVCPECGDSDLQRGEATITTPYGDWSIFEWKDRARSWFKYARQQVTGE